MSGNDETDRSTNHNDIDVIVHSTSTLPSNSPIKNGHDEMLSNQHENNKNVNGDTMSKTINSSATPQSNKNPFQRNNNSEISSQPVQIQPQQQQQSTATNKSSWVQFEPDDDLNKKEAPNKYNEPTSPVKALDNSPPPVLNTESVHINISNASPSSATTSSTTLAKISLAQPKSTSSPAVIDLPSRSSAQTTFTSPNEQGLRTIELSTGRIREGFANGDVIVTLLPINTKWPWITPAVFRPELVPEELMAQGLTLTVEEYVNAMEILVNDVRFTLYNVCYKRVLLIWVLFAFSILIGLLFSGIKGIALFSLGVAWLFINAIAIFFCMWLKLRLARGLERCLAAVNKQLIRHKIILALDDRGRISCHKVNLCFMYYDPEQCVSYLNEFIQRSEQNGQTIEAGWESRLDVDANDIVIQGSNTTHVSRKQDRAILLFLRYASRWANEVIRGLADVSLTEPGRHCASLICPCQYIERHIKCKPQGGVLGCFLNMSDTTYPPIYRS